MLAAIAFLQRCQLVYAADRSKRSCKSFGSFARQKSIYANYNTEFKITQSFYKKSLTNRPQCVILFKYSSRNLYVSHHQGCRNGRITEVVNILSFFSCVYFCGQVICPYFFILFGGVFPLVNKIC